MNSFFNAARQIDDIYLAGLPISADKTLEILCKSGNRGVYPETVLDDYGKIVNNPMSVGLERSGTTCAFLDMSLTFTTDTLRSTIFQKRDNMAVSLNNSE